MNSETSNNDRVASATAAYAVALLPQSIETAKSQYYKHEFERLLPCVVAVINSYSSVCYSPATLLEAVGLSNDGTREAYQALYREHLACLAVAGLACDTKVGRLICSHAAGPLGVEALFERESLRLGSLAFEPRYVHQARGRLRLVCKGGCSGILLGLEHGNVDFRPVIRTDGHEGRCATLDLVGDVEDPLWPGKRPVYHVREPGLLGVQQALDLSAEGAILGAEPRWSYESATPFKFVAGCNGFCYLSLATNAHDGCSLLLALGKYPKVKALRDVAAYYSLRNISRVDARLSRSGTWLYHVEAGGRGGGRPAVDVLYDLDGEGRVGGFPAHALLDVGTTFASWTVVLRLIDVAIAGRPSVADIPGLCYRRVVSANLGFFPTLEEVFRACRGRPSEAQLALAVTWCGTAHIHSYGTERSLDTVGDLYNRWLSDPEAALFKRRVGFHLPGWALVLLGAFTLSLNERPPKTVVVPIVLMLAHPSPALNVAAVCFIITLCRGLSAFAMTFDGLCYTRLTGALAVFQLGFYPRAKDVIPLIDPMVQATVSEGEVLHVAEGTMKYDDIVRVLASHAESRVGGKGQTFIALCAVAVYSTITTLLIGRWHLPGYCYLRITDSNLGYYPTLDEVFASVKDPGKLRHYGYERGLCHDHIAPCVYAHHRETAYDVYLRWQRDPSVGHRRVGANSAPLYLVGALIALFASPAPDIVHIVVVLNLVWLLVSGNITSSASCGLMAALVTCVPLTLVEPCSTSFWVIALWLGFCLRSAFDDLDTDGYCYLCVTEPYVGFLLGPCPRVRSVVPYMTRRGKYTVSVCEGTVHIAPGGPFTLDTAILEMARYANCRVGMARIPRADDGHPPGRCYKVLTTAELGEYPRCRTVAMHINQAGPFRLVRRGAMWHVTGGGDMTADRVRRILARARGRIGGLVGKDYTPGAASTHSGDSDDAYVDPSPFPVGSAITLSLFMMLMWRLHSLAPFEVSSLCILTWLGVLLRRGMVYTRPRARIYTFGSHGDVVPLTYYCHLLAALGVDVSLTNLTPGDTGHKVLEYAETNRAAAVLPRLAAAARTVRHSYELDPACIQIAPNRGFYIANGFTYDVSPPQRCLSSFRLYPQETLTSFIPNLLFGYSRYFGRPDVYIGSFRGCAPRSSDGTTLLRAHPPTTGVKGLVATGSATLRHPSLADCRARFPAVRTWYSTTKCEGFKHEGRTNHAEVFREYHTVITHGGAGTVATAVAAGCRVAIADNMRMLDRDYDDSVSFEFNDNVELFTQALLPFMSAPQAMWFCLRHFVVLGGRSGIRICTHYMRDLAASWIYATWLCSFHLVPRAILGYFAGATTLHGLLMTADVPGATFLALFAHILAPVWREVVPWRARRAIVRTVITTGFHSFLKVTFEPKWAIASAFMGLGPAMVLNAMAAASRPWLIRLFAGTIYVSGLFCRQVAPDDSKIQYRLSRMSTTHPWIPVFHAEFLNPATGMTISISTVDRQTCRLLMLPSSLSDPVLTIPTNMPVSEWGRLVESYKKHDGRPYGALRHCQTTAFDVMMETGRDPAVLLSLALTVTVASLCFVAVIAYSTAVCLCLLAFQQRALEPVAYGTRLLYMAGGNGLPDATWDEVLDWLLTGAATRRPAALVEPVNGKSYRWYIGRRSPRLDIPATRHGPTVPDGTVFAPAGLDKAASAVLLLNFDNVVESDDPAGDFASCTPLGNVWLCNDHDVDPVLRLAHAWPNLSAKYEIAVFERTVTTAPRWAVRRETRFFRTYNRLITNSHMTYFLADTIGPFGEVHEDAPFRGDVRIVDDLSEHCVIAKCVPSAWTTAAWIAAIKASRPTYKPMPCVVHTCNGVSVNDRLVDLAAVAPFLPTLCSFDSLVAEIRNNASAFLRRLDLLSQKLAIDVLEGGLSANLIRAIRAIECLLDSFGEQGRRKKGAWAPLLKVAKYSRAPELGASLSKDAIFQPLGFDDTMTHYLYSLNAARTWQDILSPTKFARAMKVNPYVDYSFGDLVSDQEVPDGVDGMVFASREICLASLARYIGTRDMEALDIGTAKAIANTIADRNPQLFKGARLADPARLFNHFMKHPKYSAGVPFEACGLRTRRALKRAGWARPLIKLATLPYETGTWLPSVAHCVPKSQVVSKEKLIMFPEKLRTIVATSVVNNMQQGILHFDINNRHDWSSSSKVGMPMNGAYMSDIFKAAAGYRRVASMDITGFDANLDDGVFRVLTELRKIGYKDHPLSQVVERHIECAMEQTKMSYIINLRDKSSEAHRAELNRDFANVYGQISDETLDRITSLVARARPFLDDRHPGGVVTKRHGGATGDSNTTWTNTTALHIILMHCYHIATGKSYSSFYDNCFLANVGDDNVFAWNDDFDCDMFVKVAKETFGVELRVESTDGIMGQTFLAKVPKPASEYADEFELYGIEPPAFAILHDPERLRMRLANFSVANSRECRHHGQRRVIYQIKRCIGYAQLCAHQKPLYDSLVLKIGLLKQSLPENMRRRRDLITPSYGDVLRAWYKRRPAGEAIATQYHFKMAYYHRCENFLLRSLHTIGQHVNRLPELQRLMPVSDATPYPGACSTTGIAEGHAWMCLKTAGKEATLEELRDMVQSSPFSSLANVDEWHDTVGVYLPTEGPRFEAYKRLVQWKLCAATAIFAYSSHLLESIAALPFGVAVLGLLNLRNFAAPKVFGILSYVYYLAQGYVPESVSSLIPRDIYYYHKRFALNVASLLPPVFGLTFAPLDTLKPLTFIGDYVRAMCSWNWWETANTTAPQPSSDEWLDAARDAVASVEIGKSVVVTAPTGTGKTKHLPAACAAITRKRHVVVVMPRQILCEQYTKLSGALWKKRGVNRTAPIMTCTYGYLSAISGMGQPDWLSDSLLLFDEAHEQSVEWAYFVDRQLASSPGILMTATPASWMKFHHIPVAVAAPHPIIWERCESPFENDLAARLATAKRAVIIVPSKKKGATIVRKLKATGFKVAHVSASNRTIPEDKTCHIVATAVIDAGVTVPECDLVLDEGLEYVNHQGVLKCVAMSKNTQIQRAGRTGRTCPGTYVYYKMPRKEVYTPSPSVSSVLARDKYAEHFKTVCTLQTPPVQVLWPDKYAHVLVEPPKGLQKYVSLYHLLCMDTHERRQADMLYVSARQGTPSTSVDYLLDELKVVRHEMPPLSVVMTAYKQCAVYYVTLEGCRAQKLSIQNNRLVHSI